MEVLQIILSETKKTFWSLSSSERSFELHAFSDMNSIVSQWKVKSKKQSKNQDLVWFIKDSTRKGASTIQNKPNP